MTRAALSMPTPQAVAALVGELVGRTTPVRKTKVDWPKERAPLTISEFRFPEGALAAALVCDLQFCCHAGAALMLLPANVAEGAIKSQKLESPLLENFAEVANVLTAIFRSFGERVVLGKIHPDLKLAPAECTALLKAVRRLDVEVEFPGYGTGRCGLLLA